MTRRVVITGMGTVNPLSSDLKAFWEGLLAGRRGQQGMGTGNPALRGLKGVWGGLVGGGKWVGFIEQFDTAKHKVKIGGEVKNFAPEKILEPKTARRLDRYAQFALVAAHLA